MKEELKEYHLLIDTLMYLNETLLEAKTQIKPWEKYSETLLIKFAIHGFTIHNIYKGLSLTSIYYPLQVNNKTIIDTSSAKAILRSQLETFLMYHHIYVNPKDDDARQLHYHAWILSSLFQRQTYPCTTEITKIQKRKDAEAIEWTISEIKKLKSFDLLTSKQKQTLIKSGNSKLFSHWSTIMLNCGFNKDHAFQVMYAHWSAYAHAEGLSVIQLTGKSLHSSSNNLDISSDLITSKLQVCLMIKALVEKYKIIEIKYHTLSETLKKQITFYIKMCSSSSF